MFQDQRYCDFLEKGNRREAVLMAWPGRCQLDRWNKTNLEKKPRGEILIFSSSFYFSKHQISLAVRHCLLLCHNLPVRCCLRCLRWIAQPVAAMFTQTSWICCSHFRDSLLTSQRFSIIWKKIWRGNSSVRFTPTLLLNLSFHTTVCQTDLCGRHIWFK